MSWCTSITVLVCVIQFLTLFFTFLSYELGSIPSIVLVVRNLQGLATLSDGSSVVHTYNVQMQPENITVTIGLSDHVETISQRLQSGDAFAVFLTLTVLYQYGFLLYYAYSAGKDDMLVVWTGLCEAISVTGWIMVLSIDYRTSTHYIGAVIFVVGLALCYVTVLFIRGEQNLVFMVAYCFSLLSALLFVVMGQPENGYYTL